MSDEHKQALAVGREQGRVVRDYLNALEINKPKRGRRRTPESIAKRLNDIEAKLSTADPLNRLQLLQERIDLQNELERNDSSVDVSAMEAAFVKVAREYGERKGISYNAWRQVGVDQSVLKKAGISRSA